MKADPRTLATLVKNAAQARTLPELNGLFNTFVRAFGFTAYAAGFVPGQSAEQPFLLLDWPRAWLELYAREGFAAEDAVVAAAATADAPFTWADVRRRQPGASARIFAAARSFGWTDGLLVPVRIAAEDEPARLGVVSLAAPTLSDLSTEGRGLVAEGSAAALHRAVALRDAPEPAALSPRERGVLELVASGRGDREIGDLLGVSTATAHFHIERAKRKLGAITRAQAVAIALAGGMITPG